MWFSNTHVCQSEQAKTGSLPTSKPGLPLLEIKFGYNAESWARTAAHRHVCTEDQRIFFLILGYRRLRFSMAVGCPELSQAAVHHAIQFQGCQVDPFIFIFLLFTEWCLIKHRDKH